MDMRYINVYLTLDSLVNTHIKRDTNKKANTCVANMPVTMNLSIHVYVHIRK